MNDRLQAPECTTNSLADIISWIKLGDCVVLQNENLLMPYGKVNLQKEDPKTYRTIYVDISTFSSLGDEGEWPYYINENGGFFCTDKDLQKRIVDPDTVPNAFCMKI